GASGISTGCPSLSTVTGNDESADAVAGDELSAAVPAVSSSPQAASNNGTTTTAVRPVSRDGRFMSCASFCRWKGARRPVGLASATRPFHRGRIGATRLATWLVLRCAEASQLRDSAGLGPDFADTRHTRAGARAKAILPGSPQFLDPSSSTGKMIMFTWQLPVGPPMH